MTKILLVLSDALRDDVARAQMGYMELLVGEHRATRYTVIGGLPSLSRSCYETVHTGVPATIHGVTTNHEARLSHMPNIFSAARAHGKTTGAAAYSWFHELYNGVFHPVMDREVEDETRNIQHGRFYSEDDFPDITCYALGALVIARHQPDYMLIHPMGLDTIGHAHGGLSQEYANAAIVQDQLLATFIPQAHLLGYDVLVTGDHGMSQQGNHNGTTPDVRHAPLYVIPHDGAGQGDTGMSVSQLAIAPTVLTRLGIPVPDTMQQPALV